MQKTKTGKMGDANVQQSSRKIRKKCRISRNKKQYWKRGAEIQDAEDFLHEVQVDTSEGGPLWKRDDDNLFSIDREADNTNDKLTRRQMAALLKRLKKKEPADEEDNTSKPKCKWALRKKFKQQADKKVDCSVNPSQSSIIDLWDCSVERKSVENTKLSRKFPNLAKETIEKHSRNVPKTMRHITSILPHVEVEPAGASYNPPISKYLDYVAEVTKEEEGKIKEKEKIEHQLALVEGEKFVTQEEKEAEMREGLDNNDEIAENEDKKEEMEEEEEKPTMKPKAKPKTRKARRSKLLERKRKEMEDVSKFQKEQMHLVFSARKMNKEIGEELREREELMEKRKINKLLKRYAGRQRLGRGEFEPCEKPVLLTDELPGSLRELKPQGCILSERLKSWQKRNILSIPGEKGTQRKLKSRLRFKNREDRKHQEVKLGTRLI